MAYAAARPYYERIEPVAESFGDLDPAIDLADRRCRGRHEWTGFHPIEQLLFETSTLTASTPLADQLVADVADLQTRTAELSANTRADSRPATATRSTRWPTARSRCSTRCRTRKITGEEEAYSHIDLLDFQANVEGSLQAFAALKPALNTIDPALVAEIVDQVRRPASPAGRPTATRRRSAGSCSTPT